MHALEWRAPGHGNDLYLTAPALAMARGQGYRSCLRLLRLQNAPIVDSYKDRFAC